MSALLSVYNKYLDLLKKLEEVFVVTALAVKKTAEAVTTNLTTPGIEMIQVAIEDSHQGP